MGSDRKVFVRSGESWEEVDEDADAAELSRSRGIAVAWDIQTASGVIAIECFDRGKCVRALTYLGEQRRWIKKGKPRPFEQTQLLADWLRRTDLSPSPDGYDVLDCFLGRAAAPPPAPPVPTIAEPNANQAFYFHVPVGWELLAAARHRAVPVSRVAHAAWELAKHPLITQLLADPNLDDFYRPKPEAIRLAPAAVPAELVGPPRELPSLELGEHKVKCALVVPTDMRDELAHVAQLFDRSLSWVLEEAWLIARPQLVVSEASRPRS
jgi:hypothetical protein